MRSSPTIVVTVSAPGGSGDAAVAERKNRLYAEALARQGARVAFLHPQAPPDERATALARMAGLVLSGGPDIDPARYGRPNERALEIEPERDALEADAWRVATERDLPVLGVCRGFQAINVFLGGTLLQHVDGHRGAPYGSGRPATHPLRLVPGTRLARLLFPTNPRGGVLTVNSYHHQAVRPEDLADGLVASGWSPSPAGDLVEAFEARGRRFVVGVQTHPERTDSTPEAFERLWRVFVDACRGAVSSRS